MADTQPFNLRSFVTRFGACVLLGAAIWFAPTPESVSDTGWQVLAVFAATIGSFLLRPLPMGPMVLIGMIMLVGTGTVPLQTTYHNADVAAEMLAGDVRADIVKEYGVLVGYGKGVVWLVVAAFLIAGAVRNTGLGRRIALILVTKLGRSTIGLGYAICGSELLLGPVVPSNTARGGGIIAPIVGSLARALCSEPDKEPRRAGEYLVLVGAHANLIAAAMFLTGMAANGLVSEVAVDNLESVTSFSWLDWFTAGIVPGLAGMLLLPWFLQKLAPPTLEDVSAARVEAGRQLAELGPWSRAEKVMASVFVLLIVLWCTEFVHHMDSETIALVGVAVLILARALTWKQACANTGAWDALFWLGGLLSMATLLLKHGVIAWFRSGIELQVDGMGPVAVAVVLALIYFYSMYGFSMLTGHITALAGTFFAVAAAAGAAPMLIVPLIAAFSNLCGCTTNYSTGPVVIYFGMGYVPTGRWFKIGFLVSLFHLVIWLGLGMMWWKLLGWW